MAETLEKFEIAAENAGRIMDWMQTRGGVVIWGCLDLGNAGRTWTGPLRTATGQPATKPHWSATDDPIRVITDPAELVVITGQEVRRFRVALKQRGLQLVLTDGGTRKVNKAVASANHKHNKPAWHEFDYSTQEAVIYVEGEREPLVEYMARTQGVSGTSR
jgi:hypothetical protein